jgi:hypothetical protein
MRKRIWKVESGRLPDDAVGLSERSRSGGEQYSDDDTSHS